MSQILPLALSLRLLGAPAFAQAPPCPAPTSTAQVLAALELAEAAYADADPVALEQARAQAEATLPCVQESVSRSLIARLHRTMGLAAFVAADTARAERSFAAARHIEPGYTFPAEVVPPGNPALDHYLALSVDHPATVALDPAPAEGRLLIEGRYATERPAAWPVVAQVLDESGHVTRTAWVWPDQPLPPYPPAPPDGPSPLADADPPRPFARKLPWLLGTVGAAATTGTLLAVSRTTAATWEDPQTVGEDRLRTLRSTANGTLYASAGAAVATVALGVVTVAW
ncbi:hypothetical protein L6R53_06950 [Myxococcota bacterium]|nr:hypothetical protein [Myxococcota bacterium]